MSEPTTAEKCRVVAERWWPLLDDDIGTCDWGYCHEDAVARRWVWEDDKWLPVCPAHLPDFPNDPVAADALLKALIESEYELELDYLRQWTISVGPEKAEDWTGGGTGANWKAALLEAAYQAALAEKGD